MNNLVISVLFNQLNPQEPASSWLTTIGKGGTVGFIIISLSLVAMALVVMHFIQIRRTSLLPQEQLIFIEKCLSEGAVDESVGHRSYCVCQASIEDLCFFG